MAVRKKSSTDTTVGTMTDRGVSLMGMFREKLSASKDELLKSEKTCDVGIPTGFLAFDFANGCRVRVIPSDGRKPYVYNSLGLTDGSMITLFGRSGCGKSTFVLQVCGYIRRYFKQRYGIDVDLHHEDAEGGLSDPRKMQFLGFKSEEEFKHSYFCRNTGITTENFFAKFSMLYDLKMDNRDSLTYDTGMEDMFGNPIIKLVPTLLFLDSLMMLYPDKYTVDKDEKGKVAGQMAAPGIARENTQIIRRIVPRLKVSNIIFFMINHILPDPSLTPKKAQNAWLKKGERLPGGETAVFLANNILRFDDNKKIFENELYGINGQLVDLQICKTRSNNPGTIIPLVLDYATGFDNELSLLELLKNNEYVSSGAWCSFVGPDDGKDYKFQNKGFKEKLRTDAEFRTQFQKLAMICLNELITVNAEGSKDSNDLEDDIDICPEEFNKNLQENEEFTMDLLSMVRTGRDTLTV